MSDRPLFAPWRIDYIRTLDKPPAGACFLCDAANATTPDDRRDRLVLWTTPLTVVGINRYPYTNGHLLVAPRAHKADLDQFTPDEHLDLQLQTTRAIALLRRAMSPQGFNIGINLGKFAGAGLPGHAHQHVVPRWAGDTNFMSVVADVRVVPQAMNQLWDELSRIADEMEVGNLKT